MSDHYKTQREVKSKDLQWFKDRIGKRIYRDDNLCHCSSCKNIVDDGLVIHDEEHARYIFENQNEYGCEGIDLNYRDEKDQDPYEAQGSNLRVHHPLQPKTQVEKWREERKLNEEAIANCGCRVLPILSNIGDVFDCKKEGTDNCNERFKKIDELQSKILIATQPIHPRYATGEFADDIENAPEYIKKSLFGNNFRKVTLLDKIKLWLKK